MSPATRAGRWTVAGHVRRATRGNAAGLRAPRILSWYARLGLLVVCTLAALPARAQDLPARVGRVNDFAEVLDAEQRHDLEGELAALERDTSVEVSVVTLRSLGGRGADEYARAIFNAWGIGKKDRANGMLILVAVQDRAVGIDGGEGGGPLEGYIPNWRSRLMRDPPRVGANDTYGASLLRGTYQVIEWVRRYENVKVERRYRATVFCIFVGLAALALGAAAGARLVVPLIFGVSATVGLFYLGAQGKLPRPWLVASALLAIGMITLGFVLGRRPRWRRRLRGRDDDSGPWIAEIGWWSRYVLQLAAVASAYLLAGSWVLILLNFGFVEFGDARRFEMLYATSFATGVATGALLVLGARMWPAIAAVSFLSSLGAPLGGIAFYLLQPTGSAVGGLTFLWLAKRYARGLKAFPHVDGLARFVACALVAAAVYATFGFFGRVVYQGVASPSTWLSAIVASFLGIIIVTPVITLWATGAPWRWSARRGLEFAAVLVVTAVTGWLVFGNSPAGLERSPIPFVVLPVLLWPAFRLGARETVTTTLLLSLIATTGSALGYGPFAEWPILLRVFLAVCAIGALAVAAEVGRRETVEAEVRTLNEDLEQRVSARAQELVRAHATLRRARVRHAAAMRHVHARIAADLHDSVGASLSRIAILSDVALRESEASATATTGALAKIGDNARAVIDEMSDAVWFVDPRMEDIQQMVVRLRVVTAALFESNGTDWGIDAVSKLLSLTLTPDQRRHLFLILKEALTNVHRHAHATVVRVTLSATDSGLRAVIEDNGTGMRPEHAGPGHGNGMANMQKRARELRGTLSVQSRPVIAGTRIVVDVPLPH